MSTRMLATIAFCALIDFSSLTANAAQDDYEHLFYLNDQRAIVFRVHLKVDGEPVQERWSKFLDKLVKTYDKNNDGELSSVEAMKLPSYRSLASVGVVGAGGSSGVTVARPDKNKDKVVDRNELNEYFDKIGFGSFSIRSSQVTRRISYGFGAAGNGSQLFEILDTNKDKQLSRNEIDALPTELMKMDIDDDETISTAELAATGGINRQQIMNRPNQGRPQPPRTRIVSSRTTTSNAIASQLIGFLDQPIKDRQLSRRELGLSDAAFRKYDNNNDGLLDLSETAQFVDNPIPIADVTISLGSQLRNRPQVSLVSRTDEGAFHYLELEIRVVSTTSISVKIDRMRFTLDATPTSTALNPKSMAQRYMTAFDRNKNEYLERTELNRNPNLRNAFMTIDKDRDGKIFLKEFEAYYVQQFEFQQQRTEMYMAEGGANLFEVFDANGDLRLSPREIRGVNEKVKNLDTNGDDAITEKEIPGQIQLRFGMGNATGARTGVVVRSPFGQTNRAPTQLRGPNWFQKMDRNQDGDVSRSEFIGELAKFKKLDKNDDGLIDADEAVAP